MMQLLLKYIEAQMPKPQRLDATKTFEEWRICFLFPVTLR